MVRKIIVLSLALILSFVFIGCGEQGLTQEEIEQIVANSATATAEADTYKFDMDTAMTIEVIGGTEASELTIEVDSTGVVDNVSRDMQMTGNATMGITGQGKQEMAIELYLVGDWAYMKEGTPGQDEQWAKIRLTKEIRRQWDTVNSQIELLTAQMEVNSLGSEDVNGTTCYAMEIIPTGEALSKWLGQQQTPGIGDIDWAQFELDDLFEKLAFKQWIAKDSYLLMQAQVHMLMEMSPEDVGATREDFKKMVMSIDINIKTYDYDKAVSIGLPEEALEAPEVSE